MYFYQPNELYTRDICLDGNFYLCEKFHYFIRCGACLIEFRYKVEISRCRRAVQTT